MSLFAISNKRVGKKERNQSSKGNRLCKSKK